MKAVKCDACCREKTPADQFWKTLTVRQDGHGDIRPEMLEMDICATCYERLQDWMRMPAEKLKPLQPAAEQTEQKETKVTKMRRKPA